MTAKDAFAELRNLLRKRAMLQRRLDRIQDAAYNVAGGIGDGMPRATDTDARVERGVLDGEELQADIAIIDHDIATYQRCIRPSIEGMPTGIERTLLRMRYLEGKTMKETAKKAGYNRQHGYRALAAAEKVLCDYLTKMRHCGT